MARRPLALSSDLSLPLDTVTQAIGIVAKRRAGKSYLARKVTEQLAGAGMQVVIVDPKGDWWGIRSAADGKAAGLPIVIVGGERGDVPLEAGGGELVAKLVVEERVSALLDMSLLRKHEVSTFMTSFLETLYRLKAREQYRTPVMLMIDEADAIAPQKPQPNEARMLGAVEDIVRRGGQRGIGCTLITQRTAVLNKNVLTQVQILIALRTIAPQDLKAMRAWIDVHGTDEERETLMASLPSLPVGDAWVWSPGWPTNEGIFQRIHTAPIETFDSGRTPKPGERHVDPKGVAQVDLDVFRMQMAETIERAKADDPKVLRARVKALELDLGRLRATTPPVESTGLHATRTKLKEAERMVVELRRSNAQALRVLERAGGNLLAIVRDLEAAALLLRERPADPAQRPAVLAARMDVSYGHTRKPGAGAKRVPSSGDADLPRGERAVLTALAQHPEGCGRGQLTALTGYKRSTRDAYLQRLRERGLIEHRGDESFATDAGIVALGDFEPLPTGDALLQHWLGKLPEGERKVLEAVAAAGSDGLDREAIDERTSYKRSTRDAYIQRLQARRLVDVERGLVVPVAELFDA